MSKVFSVAAMALLVFVALGPATWQPRSGLGFELDHFVGLCARTLAHAHAKAGDPIALDAYLGEDDAFSDAITEFAQRYADQNDRDYAAFADAVGSGRIAVDDVAPTS